MHTSTFGHDTPAKLMSVSPVPVGSGEKTGDQFCPSQRSASVEVLSGSLPFCLSPTAMHMAADGQETAASVAGVPRSGGAAIVHVLPFHNSAMPDRNPS